MLSVHTHVVSLASGLAILNARVSNLHLLCSDLGFLHILSRNVTDPWEKFLEELHRCYDESFTRLCFDQP